MKSHRTQPVARRLLGATLALLMAGSAVLPGAALAQQAAPATPPPATAAPAPGTTPPSVAPLSQGPASVADLAQGLLGAVVNISTSQNVKGSDGPGSGADAGTAGRFAVP